MTEPPKTRGSIAGHAADGARRRDIFFGEGAEHVLQRIDRATPAILPLGVGHAGAAQIAHDRGILLAALEEATDPIRDRRRADVGEEQGAVEWLENLRRGSDRRAEDGCAARQRFHRDQAESLELAGRQHERVGRAVVGGQVTLGHEAEEPDVLGQAERDREGLEQRAQRAGAADQQEHAGKALPHGGHRPDQRVEPHARLEVAQREEERAIARQPQRLPLGLSRAAGMEALDVGAPHDLHDPLSADAVEIPEQTGREVAQHLDAARPLE